MSSDRTLVWAAVLLLAGNAAASTPLNETYPNQLQRMLRGEPVQAMRDVYTNVLGSFFYALVIGAIFTALWIKTQNIIFATMVLDSYVYVFRNYFPPEVMIILYTLNFMMFGLLIHRMMRP